MNIAQLKRALRLFRNPLASRHTVRYNAMAYLAALEYLGESWVLSKQNAIVRK